MGSHHHSGPHDHRRSSARRLAWTLALVAGYSVAEVVGGLVTGSLALLADAGHMLSDAAALGLALFAMWLARRPPTAQRTFGYYRTEILAALANGGALVAISILIFVEAWERVAAPPAVRAPGMMAVATGGLLVNLAALAILHRDKEASLNLRGAWLHVLTDTLGSVQALGAGALIWAFDWRLADPVASVLIGLLVIYSAWHLLRESIAVLMEGTPGHIDVDELRGEMLRDSGALEVHDLHVWTISSGFVALSAHVVCADGCGRDALLTRLRGRLRERFGLEHVTLQLEPERWESSRGRPCGLRLGAGQV